MALFVLADEGTIIREGPEVDRAITVAKQWYATLAPKLAPTNVPFADIYRQPFRLDEEYHVIKTDEMGTRADIRGQLCFILEQPNNRLTTIWNDSLMRFLKTNNVQCIQSLTTNEAVERAQNYLDIIGVKIPSIRLREVVFGYYAPNEWYVGWDRTFQGYRFDSFLTFLSQSVSVSFHERYGFLGFYCYDVLPPPCTTDVKISREDAVAKGEKAVPLVMKTPFYRMCRLPDFKVRGIKKAELLIAAPNWLLDPKRAVWMRDKPPEETRLCWVVTYETIGTKVYEGGLRSIPPDILIYIDAATGEIVGANFT